jgi:lysophospholipase L1-like esterase
MPKLPNICDYHSIYESEVPDNFCDPAFNDHSLIAEGDSWFTIGGFQLQNPWFSNLLYSLRFKREVLILNLAEPGDTIKHISAMPRDQSFKYVIEEHLNDPWDAILLSAGGNDLIDKAHTLILNKLERQGISINQPADYCNAFAVDSFLQNIVNHFRRLAAIRGNHKIPIVLHSYDYPTPRNAPARFFGIGLLGPWLYPCMLNAEIPKHDWIDVSDYLFDQLAERLLSLSRGANPISDFHVIDTRNTLTRATLNSTGNSGDWLNEIHPNKNGYKKIARLIEQKLRIVTAIN